MKRSLILLFLFTVFQVAFASNDLPDFNLSEESRNYLVNLRAKQRTNAFVAAFEKHYFYLESEIENEINQFFSRAALNAGDFAKQASGFYVDNPENRKALMEQYEKHFYNADELRQFQIRLAEKVHLQLKDRLEKVFHEHFIICDSPINEGAYVEINPELDMAFFTANKVALASKTVIGIIELAYGPAGIIKGLVCSFGTQSINPFGDGWSEGKIESQVKNQIFADAEKCRKHFLDRLRANFAESKALLEQVLIEKFINHGGDK